MKTDDQGYVQFGPDYDPSSLRRWYLALPWYGVVAEKSIRALHRIGAPNYGVRGRINRWRNRHDRRRAARVLAQARKLVYTSPYIHDPDRETGVEGYFDLPGGLSYGLTIHSQSSQQEEARFAWAHGELHRLRTWSWAEDVVVPTPRVEPDQVEEVLRRWYVDRFRWKWGHWSNREGRLPEFEVTLSWEHQALEDSAP